MRRLALITVFSSLGCLAPTQETESPDGSSSTPSSCSAKPTSTLAGVSIRFPDQPCSYTLSQAAAGVVFRYEVQVGSPRAVTFKHVGCDTPGPGGLIIRELLEGSSQRYCVCDTGLCADRDLKQSLASGTFAGSFTWDGKNWTGPSDTQNPKGAAFPTGTYEFIVSSTGINDSTGQSFAVEGRMGFTLTR